MKQREFVVVLLRLFAFWLAVQAVINFVQGVIEPSVREGPFISLVFIVVALLLILGISAMVWIKSEQLMRRAYAGSESWETLPMEYEDVPESEAPTADGPLPMPEIAETEYYEPTTSFSPGITTRDILMGFMMALGIWLLVSSVPGIILLVIRYISLPSSFNDGVTKQLTQQLIYWGIQVVLGIVMLRPRRIVDLLWKLDSPSTEAVGAESTT